MTDEAELRFSCSCCCVSIVYSTGKQIKFPSYSFSRDSVIIVTVRSKIITTYLLKRRFSAEVYV